MENRPELDKQIAPEAEKTPTKSLTYAAAYDALLEVAERLQIASPDEIEKLAKEYHNAMAACRFCANRLGLITVKRPISD